MSMYNCTGELKAFDLTVNQLFKTLMKECFAQWYAEQVGDILREGVNMT